MDAKKVDPHNPKDLIGSAKLPLHLWPASATAMGCLGILEGKSKYGRTNWRASKVRASIYVDAAKRHIEAWFEGEDNTPDSGLPHLANALASLAIIVDAQANGTLIDDRCYNGLGYRKLVESLTPHVPRIMEMFAEKDPKHYTIQDSYAEGFSEHVAREEDALLIAESNASVAGDDWIEWDGPTVLGERPVDGDTVVEVVLRNGTVLEGKAYTFFWNHDIEKPNRIIKYRVVENE